MLVIKSYEELGRAPAVGDRVKIVNERAGAGWNNQGLMDKYLGTIMTIRAITCRRPSPTAFTLGMFEDREDWYDGWSWSHNMIEGVVIDEIEDILEDPATWASGSELEALLT